MRQRVAGIACVVLLGILASTYAFAQQKTAKQCDAEWTANKPAIQASGKTKKVFVAECRGTTAAGIPSQSTTTPQSTPPRQTHATTSSATTSSPTTASPTTASPTGLGQFGTEVAARAHCPTDTVVWANLESKIYHFNGSRDYGHTKRGAYMCERETTGFRAAKNEKHP
jgi:hypothetical protein